MTDDVQAAVRPDLHGLLPEDLAAHLVAAGVDCSPHAARSLLARALAPPEVRRPRRETVARRVRDAVSALTTHHRLEVVERAEDPADGFVKYLLRCPDGALTEAVRIPLAAPGCYTICLSSQVGCAMSCAFCATARLGLRRHLAAWEMVSAYCVVRDEAAPGRVTGAVFMGQGEPLHNYDAVLRAAAVLSHPCGGRIAARAITVSTVGLVPQIRRFARERHPYRLIVSLTSALPERRAALMPITRKYDLAALAGALRELAAATGDRVTIAWVVMRGVNTDAAEVAALRELLGDLPLRVNLIDLNDTGDPAYQRAGADELAAFRTELAALGVPIVRRYSGGQARHAACGMLAATTETQRRAAPPLAASEPAR